jgi:predicted nuclease of predicted toxin-antitoxin system
MRFLLDANMPRSAASLLRSLGHEAEDVRDALLSGADDSLVAAHARARGFALVTRDFDFSDIRNYPPENYSGLVVLQLPDDATAPQINRTLEAFVTNLEWVSRLPGRLAIVESWRVRFRPA